MEAESFSQTPLVKSTCIGKRREREREGEGEGERGKGRGGGRKGEGERIPEREREEKEKRQRQSGSERDSVPVIIKQLANVAIFYLCSGAFPFIAIPTSKIKGAYGSMVPMAKSPHRNLAFCLI